MLLNLTPISFNSGIKSCKRSKSMGRNAPVEESSDILMVPPVKINNTALDLSTVFF